MQISPNSFKLYMIHIDNAILRYRSQIPRPCDIMSPRHWTILCTNACLTRALLTGTDRTHMLSIRQTMQNGDNYLRDGHLILIGPDIRPVGDGVMPRLATHPLFDLYFAHSTSSLFKPTTMTVAAGESFLGSQQRNALPMPTLCSVNKSVWIVKV